MRIACVHVPQFALQCVTRIDPSLRGAAIAVVGSGLDPAGGTVARAALHSPIVMACSRAAWALGVRIGMTAPAARNASPEVRVVTADAQLERDTTRALADALLGASPVVDVGGRVGPGAAHLAMYCEVPSRTRGSAFGERLIDRLAAIGVTCRIGIADDRFTAWVAATSHEAGAGARADEAGVVAVPRGGSAAFLAPRPLSLLAISPEVQHMLESLGVRSLGEFAALPAPSVSRPVEADYQGLARGDSGNVLRPYAPDLAIREHAVITPGGMLSGPAAVAMLASRIELRLTGRGRGAARLEVTIGGEAGERTVAIAPAQEGRVLETAEDLAEAIGGAIGDLGAAWRVRVAVIGEALAPAAAATAPASASAVGAAGEVVVSEARTASDPEAVVEQVDLEDSGAVRVAADGEADGEAGMNLTLPLLAAERRSGHRRTRHGKRRPRTGRSGEAVDGLLQAKLFKNQP